MLNLERAEWLETLRRTTRQHYDDRAETYDLDDTPIDATHARYVSSVIESCPPGGHILDAACGTGRYFTAVLAGGRRITGVDQSAAMVRVASARYAQASARVLGLQELDYAQDFDAAMVVDAMEYVPPEAWPTVLNGLHRAVRTGGRVYLSVERTDDHALADAYASATADGLPVVAGEYAGRGGSYHYYPQLDQVRAWLADARLSLIEEAHSDGAHPSYSYQHFLTEVRL